MGSCNDRIILKGMEFYGHHGVLPAEQELGQRFQVDVELVCNLAAAGRSDDLSRSVDYSRVFRLVEGIVTGRKYKLIEAVAERIAGELLAAFPVEEVVVRVKKPQAPLGGVFAWAAVEIKRGRAKP